MNQLWVYGITFVILILAMPFIYKFVKNFIKEERKINKMLKGTCLIIALFLIGVIVYFGIDFGLLFDMSIVRDNVGSIVGIFQ